MAETFTSSDPLRAAPWNGAVERWNYANWPSITPDWGGAGQGANPDDNVDFHVDIGCGKVKKGRIGIDRWLVPGVDIVMDLERMQAPHPYPHGDVVWANVRGLPFADSQIESIISHHALEHLTSGALIRLMDDCYRVLKPGGLMRIIVPLWPSHAAVADVDHKTHFAEGSFESFCGFPDNHWQDSFSVPYSKARFQLTDKVCSPQPPYEVFGTPQDAREIRVSLVSNKAP